MNLPNLPPLLTNSLSIEGCRFLQNLISFFLAGGWGAAYDLRLFGNTSEKKCLLMLTSQGHLIGAICHGVLGLN